MTRPRVNLEVTDPGFRHEDRAVRAIVACRERIQRWRDNVREPSEMVAGAAEFHRRRVTAINLATG